VKRRRILWIAGVVVVVAAAAALSWPREREPVYQGKKLSEWLKEYETTHPLGNRDDAAADEAVRHMGRNALPWLVRWVEYKPAAWKERVGKVAGRIPGLGSDRLLEDEILPVLALDGFAALGSEAQPAIPELVRFVTDPHRRADQGLPMMALIYTGQEGLAQVTNFLRNFNPAVRREAALTLALLSKSTAGRTFGQAAGPLAQALSDNDPLVRRAATNALGAIAPDVLKANKQVPPR